MAKIKKLKSPLLVVGFSLLAIGFAAAVVQLSFNHLDKPTRSGSQKCPDGNQIVHEVAIKDDKAVPNHTSALLCESLIITNYDDSARLMAFGVHDKHLIYDGISEKLLQKGQNLTVSLNQKGTFTFHDHIGDKSQGSFTVN